MNKDEELKDIEAIERNITQKHSYYAACVAACVLFISFSTSCSVNKIVSSKPEFLLAENNLRLAHQDIKKCRIDSLRKDTIIEEMAKTNNSLVSEKFFNHTESPENDN
jgi:hypothetical protein